MILFAGPELPYKLGYSAMATSPDGGGVILFGGWIGYKRDNGDKSAREDTILELGYDADEWKILGKLKQPRDQHVVIPIS